MKKALLTFTLLSFYCASLLAGDPHIVGIGWDTFLCSPTADNINVRTAPDINAPVAKDKWGNKETVSTTHKLIGRYSPINGDWVEIFSGISCDTSNEPICLRQIHSTCDDCRLRGACTKFHSVSHYLLPQGTGG